MKELPAARVIAFLDKAPSQLVLADLNGCASLFGGHLEQDFGNRQIPGA